jgi:(+)-neomenthol dehydrogenase
MKITGKLERIRWHTTDPYDKAEECLRTNYHGTKIVTEAHLPPLHLSEERLDELSESFLRDFKNGQLEPCGWPT